MILFRVSRGRTGIVIIIFCNRVSSIYVGSLGDVAQSIADNNTKLMLNCTKNISDEISHLAIGFDQAAHTVRRSAADQTVFARRVARPRAETARDEK